MPKVIYPPGSIAEQTLQVRLRENFVPDEDEPRFLVGKDYPELCETCRSAIDSVVEQVMEGPDTEDQESPLLFAGDHRLMCGGDHCRVREDRERRKKQKQGHLPYAGQDILNRYPKLTAHMICESLGYFTPTSAANAIAAYLNKEECYCEWYMDMHGKSQHYPNTPHTMLEVGERTVKRAITLRRSHSGFMAEYKRAFLLVKAEQVGQGPLFMSW